MTTVAEIVGTLTTTQIGILQHAHEGFIVSDTPHVGATVRSLAVAGKAPAVTAVVRGLAELGLLRRATGRHWRPTPAGEQVLALKAGGAR